MNDKYQDAIIAAGEKDYSTFQKNISAVAEDKIKSTLSGFIKYLEKNAFEDVKEK